MRLGDEAVTAKDAAEFPEHAPLRNSVNRDDAHERAEWKKYHGRGRWMRHGELPSNFAVTAIASATNKGHGEKLIFF